MQIAQTGDEIRWPLEFHPANVEVHVRNEVLIKAYPEQVWAWLIRAPGWPAFYENAHDVHLMNEPGPDLRLGTRFRWKTFGIPLTSEVLEFVPGERLAWSAKGLGTWVYHAWLLRPVNGGCWVLTEENQHGWLCRLQKSLCPQNMYKKHQLWLEGLKKAAER